MKKIFIIFVLFFVIQAVMAESLCEIKYKNLPYNTKLTYLNNVWGTKNVRNDRLYYKKIKNLKSFKTELVSSKNNVHFLLNSDYEFIVDGRLVGYSNEDLKFYEYQIDCNNLYQRELFESEIQELFPKCKILKVSDFSDTTNSIKISKGKKDLKLLLLNDTEASFYNYWFSTNNAEIMLYELKGFVNITKKGLIQFSRNDDNYERNAWYVILVR